MLAGGRRSSLNDIYSFGNLAWHLISLDSPEFDLLDSQILYCVCEEGWLPGFPDSTQDAFKKIGKVWSKEQSERLSFSKLRRLTTTLLHNSR